MDRGKLEVFETEDPVEPTGLEQVFTQAKKAPEVHTDKATLVQTTMPAREAFLRFQRDALAKDGNDSRFFHRNYKLAGSGGGAGGAAQAPEDPLSKYNRLQAELADLRAELEGLTGRDEAAKDLFTEVKAQEAAELSTATHVLQGQLEQIGKTEAFQTFLAPRFDGQSTIASQTLLQKIKELQAAPGDGGGSGEGSAGAGAGGGAGGGGGAADGGLTYELFFNKALQKETGHSSLNALENRLYQLEQMVGLKSLDAAGGTHAVSAAGQPAPLSDVVSRLEERVRLLDPKTLTRLQQKMELLNKEFETFTARRNQAKAGRVALTEDIHRERLDKLFATVQQWAPVAETIPTLISRMQTLKALHEESALFSQRLFGLESMQEALHKMLQADEKALGNVQKSVAENIETVLANVAAVDQRIAEITKAVG